MAAHKNGSLIHIINRASVFFKNGSYRKRILLTSLKPVQCQRRTVSSIGDRNTNLTPHLSSNLAGWSYNELYELSVKDPETFWGSIAKERLTWNKPFDQVRDCEITSGKINWFLGGQLNVSGKNCHPLLLLLLATLNIYYPIALQPFYIDRKCVLKTYFLLGLSYCIVFVCVDLKVC